MKRLIILFIALPLFFSSCKKDKTEPIPEPVTDIDGNVYKTVKIGDQVWMAENLKVTKLNDETPIAWVTTRQTWVETELPSFCGYENSQSNVVKYGALYNWAAVNTGKLAPKGWHVPTNEEWATLIEYLGGESLAPAKMKEIGTEHWESPNSGASNQSGFTAIPSGIRNEEGYYYSLGTSANWWSATEGNSSTAYNCSLTSNGSDPLRAQTYKECGFSVRCIKD